jgi:hypothetical protein
LSAKNLRLPDKSEVIGPFELETKSEAGDRGDPLSGPVVGVHGAPGWNLEFTYKGFAMMEGLVWSWPYA